MRALVRRAGLVTMIALGLAACGHATTPPQGGGTSGTPSPPAATSSPSAGVTSPPAPSATAQLAPFISAAEQADSQLHHAAALVNAEIGATSMRFSPATLAAVHALSDSAAGRAIPAGMPVELLRSVLTVYGDLSARTGAFGGVRLYGYGGHELPIGGQDAKSVLRGLHNGAPVAARFDADLATVRSLAQQTPPLTVAPPVSRPAAELALRVNSIDKHNFCSELFGGYAPTQLETVTWTTDQPSQHYQGTIGGTAFQADYTAAHGWLININAC